MRRWPIEKRLRIDCDSLALYPMRDEDAVVAHRLIPPPFR